MGVKKIISLILVVVMIFSGHMYLKNKYNPMAVEISVRDSLTEKEFKRIKGKFHINSYSINYKTVYQGDNLIMTSGMDTQIKDIKIIHGEFIADTKMTIVVMGDKVSDKYFRTENGVGRTVTILGREYKVVGIIENSDTIYIPFNEELLNLNWEKKTLSYVVPDEDMFYLTVEGVDNEINSIGIEIIDRVVYKEKINGYSNLLILLLLIFLIKKTYQIFRKLKEEISSLVGGYKEVYRSTEWYKYIINEKKYFLKGLLKIIFIASLMFTMVKIIKYISIPSSLVPDNFFSLMSYIYMVRLWSDKFLLNLQNGFSEISIDTIIMNIIMVAIMIIYGYVQKLKIHKKQI